MLGLAEYAWVTTVNCLDIADLKFEDYIEVSHRLVDYLSKYSLFHQFILFLIYSGNEQGCNFIVALTHMRVVNDKRYADNAIGVDLILGGHDHIYWIE